MKKPSGRPNGRPRLELAGFVNEFGVAAEMFIEVRRNDAVWLCRCKCGRGFECPASVVKRRQSCNECRSHKIKHGHVAGGKWSTEYNSWRAMVSRCTDPKNNRYYAYGAKGITVCERWKTFAHFLADMGLKPTSQRHSLDRIDNTKGYYKENCRWATYSQQSKNRRPFPVGLPMALRQPARNSP